MARPLRVQHPGGWTHAMSRGIDKQPIFDGDRDREHFLELLGKAVERYRIRLHAYVLMDNHFHLLVETPEGNLSAALQWIKQSYSMWHNITHNRVGPLFQGRFRSVPVEDSGWAYEWSPYIHLNPLRLARFRMSRVERQGGAVQPEALPTPAVEGELRERLTDALAVGTAAFAKRIRERMRAGGREMSGRKEAREKADLDTVIRLVERQTGALVRRGKRGGPARDLALKLARDCCGVTLRELGERMGGMDYAAVHMAIRRLETKMRKNRPLASQYDVIKRGLFHVKT